MSKTDSIKFCQYTIFRPISIRLAADMSQWLRSVKTQSEARWCLNKSANWWEFLIINGPFHVADVKNMAKHVNLAGKSHQMVIKWRKSWRFSWENHRYVRDFPGMWKIAGGYLLSGFWCFLGILSSICPSIFEEMGMKDLSRCAFFQCIKLLPRCDSTTFDGSKFPVPLVPSYLPFQFS